MRRLLVRAVAGVFASLFAAPALCAAAADQQWTFCVASTRGGDDVWITDVFAATRGHERLEGELKAYLASRGASRIDAQCPAPAADKTAAVNAQFAAVEFNRKLGSALHEAPARDFVRKR